MVAVGRFTPNGWALQQLKAILAGDLAFPGMVRALVILAALGCLFFVASTWRLRSRFARG
jgi:hypothetical protein